jgi:hypothetical protein
MLPCMGLIGGGMTFMGSPYADFFLGGSNLRSLVTGLSARFSSDGDTTCRPSWSLCARIAIFD